VPEKQRGLKHRATKAESAVFKVYQHPPSADFAFGCIHDYSWLKSGRNRKIELAPGPGVIDPIAI